jgi:GNAT superfamily N-acetyltransferase
VFTIAPADPDSPDSRMLLAELGAALAAMTGSDGTASFDAADVRGQRACFLVARAADGLAVGCGALRPLGDSVAELKRMYARPRSGAGRYILDALERQAAASGYAQLWLETRRVNMRAVAFYEKHGYCAIPNYGKYIGRLDAICLGKQLSSGGGEPTPVQVFL